MGGAHFQSKSIGFTSLFVQNGILTSIYVSDVCSYNLDKICPNSRKVTKVYFYVIVDAVRANIYI